MSVHVVHAGQTARRRRWPDLVDRTDEPVVAAIVRLRAEGHFGEFVAEPDSIPPGVFCRTCGRRHFVERLHVLAATQFRGAGAGDPESIVFRVRCPRCETPGLLISRHGPAVTADETELLRRIASRVASPAEPAPPAAGGDLIGRCIEA